MQELFADFAAEGLPAVARAFAALAFTLLGSAAELSALSTLQTGALAFGLWKVYVGTLALYAGLVVFGPINSPLPDPPERPDA
jgi:hypothetical protein